jgi:aspartate aminotransferase-like enzyme
LASLAAALEGYATPARATAQYAQYTARGTHVRRALRALNIAPLAADRCASPAVTTFRPPCTSPAEFALLCRALGYAVNAGSSSLSRRGLAQIATMGAVTHDDVDGFFAQLGRWLDRLSDQRKAYPDRAIH